MKRFFVGLVVPCAIGMFAPVVHADLFKELGKAAESLSKKPKPAKTEQQTEPAQSQPSQPATSTAATSPAGQGEAPSAGAGVDGPAIPGWYPAEKQRHILVYKPEPAKAATMIITRAKATSVSDAQSKKITQVKDGEPFWLYIKTTKPLIQYSDSNIDAPGNIPEIMITVGNRASSRGLIEGSNCFITLSPAQYKATELVFDLSSVVARIVKSGDGTKTKEEKNECILRMFGDTLKRGVHNLVFYFRDEYDDMRLARNLPVNADLVAAEAELAIDLTNGFSKYRDITDAGNECDLTRPRQGMKQCKITTP
jgi:hypothetical protein